MQTHSFSRTAYWAFTLLVVLSILAAALPQPGRAAVEANCAETHTVKNGETIWRIARTYGVTVNRLAKTNGLEFPYPLTVGQSLCIPQVPSASSSVKWSAVLSGDDVDLSGTGFKKQVPYYVKVRENDQSKWYKLGWTQTNKRGELDDSFDLPKDLEKKAVLTVCIKDGYTDLLQCKQTYRR